MTSTIAQAVLFLSRSLAVSILFKASVMLVLGLVGASLARRSRAALCHVILAATFGTLIVLPSISASSRRFLVEIPILGATEPVAHGTPRPSSPSTSPSALSNAGPYRAEARDSSLPSWRLVGGFIWMTGTVISLLLIGANLWWLRRLRRNGLPWPEMQARAASLRAECGVRRPVEVLLHEETEAPLMCGLWSPSIILPSKARHWSDIELRCAMVHELEHVRRGDWGTQLLARAICACYWFHPLVWIAWRRLCLEAERACDDAVIQQEGCAEYAAQLVSLARRMSNPQAQPVLGMANRSDLSRRVSALLDATQPRGRVGRPGVAAILICAALVVLAVAPVQVVAQSSVFHKSPTTSKERQRDASSVLVRALYEAAETGDIPSMQRLANSGADLNARLPGDGSPLIGAARNGQAAAVRWLLDRGADPNMPVRGDGDPLIMAARGGHIDVVTLLLDRGADINRMVPGDENALIQASGTGHLDVVKLLISRGADINARIWVEGPRGENGEWRSPLSMARENGYSNVVAYLLSVGAHE